jgi:hypothetical protein
MDHVYNKMLTYLQKSQNPASDQAMGSALLYARGQQIEELAQVLLERGKDEGIVYVVRMYHKLGAAHRQALIDRCPGISGALRLACKDTDSQVRDNVISIVHASNHPKLLYFLSLLLRDEVSALRARAAHAFKSISLSLLDRVRADREESKNSADYAPSSSVTENLKQLFLALDLSLENFTCHLRTEIVEVAMIFASILPDAIWGKFTGERSRVGRIATEILTRESNILFAGFAFRSLSCPELGKNTVRVIASSYNGDFLRRWLDYSWYRFDANVRKNLARIKEFRWLSGNYQPLLDTPQDLQIKFVDILMLTAVPTREKLEILSSLLMSRGETVQEHVVSVLVDSELPEKRQYLARMVSMSQTQMISISESAMDMAVRYLQQNKSEVFFEDGRTDVFAFSANSDTDLEKYFNQFWISFDRMELSNCHLAGEKLLNQGLDFGTRLREKLKSDNYTDRLRGLSLIRRANLTKEFTQEIYGLCKDSHVMVRSSAVSALGDVNTPEVEQILIESMDDENLRVQANAIEVLETKNVSNLYELVETKLLSANNRVRANAIKAILKPQYSIAIRAMMAMLDHPDPSFRRSALWAVSQTIPLQLAKKVNRMMKEDPDPEVKTAATKTIQDMIRFWKDSQSTEEQAVPEGVKS